jgi:hypothetical protein
MMGLFGSSIDDPKTLGILQLASGLMSSPRFGQGMSQGLLAYGDTMQRAKQQQAQEKMNALREEQARMQMEQMRAQMQQQQTDQQAMRGMFTPMSGPTQDQGPLMPNFDPRAMLAQNASPEAAMQALGLHSAMNPKPPKRQFEKVEGHLLEIPEQGAPQSVFKADPKPPEQSPLARLLAERDQLPPGHPMRQIYDQRIKKESTHQPPSSQTVTMGGLTPIQLADGTTVFGQAPNRPGLPVQISRLPDGMLARPPAPPMPASTKEKIAENRVSLQKIKKAIANVEANPQSLGAQNYLGDPLNQRIDPKGVDVRADIADIGSQKIHDRSGAAVTLSEAPRLMPFIPLTTDTPDTARKKLKRLEKEYESVIQSLNSGASIQQATGASAPSGDGWKIEPAN